MFSIEATAFFRSVVSFKRILILPDQRSSYAIISGSDGSYGEVITMSSTTPTIVLSFPAQLILVPTGDFSPIVLMAAWLNRTLLLSPLRKSLPSKTFVCTVLAKSSLVNIKPTTRFDTSGAPDQRMPAVD